MPRKRKTDQAEDALATKRPRRARTSRGVLERMPEMPLDILFEIFKYFVPMDLLNLSRTMKVFRRFLMARSAAPLWKTARLNVKGLPECPAHLSEPAYANLAFDTHCNSCYKPNVKIVFWSLSVRYCPGCRNQNLVKCRWSSWLCSRAQRDMIVLYSGGLSGREHLHLPGYSPSKAREEFDALDKEGQAAHKLQIRNTLNWAMECEHWDSLRGSNREAELEALRESRLNSIVAHLRDLDWGDELDRMHPTYGPLTRHADVHKAQVLTDRIWNNIRDGVVKWMQSFRAQRIEQERLDALTGRCQTFRLVYTAWYAKQKDKGVLPRAIDLMCRPEMRAIFEQDTDHPVSHADFDTFTSRFAQWSAEWKAQCDERLRELVRNSPSFKNEIFDGVDPLSLARVVFTCSDCSKYMVCQERDPLLYPGILTHDCMYESIFYGEDVGALSLFERASRNASSAETLGFRHASWSCKHIEAGAYEEQMVDIIKILGMDPSRATRDDLDAIDDVRIYCSDCPRSSSEFLQVMNWRHALQHLFYHINTSLIRLVPRDERKPLLKRITEQDLLRVVLQKEAEFTAMLAGGLAGGPDFGYRYNCSHCVKRRFSLPAVHNHLNRQHAVEHPTETDFYLSPDAELSINKETVLVHPTLKETTTEDQRKLVDNSKRAAWYNFLAAAPSSASSSTMAINTALMFRLFDF